MTIGRYVVLDNNGVNNKKWSVGIPTYNCKLCVENRLADLALLVPPMRLCSFNSYLHDSR